MSTRTAEKVSPVAERFEARLIALSHKPGYIPVADTLTHLNPHPGDFKARLQITTMALTVQAALVSHRFTLEQLDAAVDDFLSPVARTPEGQALQRARGLLGRMVAKGLGLSTDGLPSWTRRHTERGAA